MLIGVGQGHLSEGLGTGFGVACRPDEETGWVVANCAVVILVAAAERRGRATAFPLFFGAGIMPVLGVAPILSPLAASVDRMRFACLVARQPLSGSAEAV